VATQAALDVRIRTQRHQCLAAGVRRSVILESDPGAPLGVPVSGPPSGEGGGRRVAAGAAGRARRPRGRWPAAGDFDRAPVMTTTTGAVVRAPRARAAPHHDSRPPLPGTPLPAG